MDWWIAIFVFVFFFFLLLKAGDSRVGGGGGEELEVEREEIGEGTEKWECYGRRLEVEICACH